MKRQKFPILLLLAVVFSLTGKVYAQCNAPVSSTVTTSFATCAGQGGVQVTDVLPTQSNTSLQYALYDSANLNVVKPFQVSNNFAQVSVGKYRVRIRRICQVGTTTDYTSPVVSVLGNTTPISNTSTLLTLRPTTCNNGIVATGPAAGGAGGYEYALVPSANAPEPVTNYVRPRRTANGSTFSSDAIYAGYIYFDSLAAGTYYVRSYDQCGSFTTSSVAIATITEPASQIALSKIERTQCDSVDLSLKPYSFTRRFSNITATIAPFNRVVTSGGYTYTLAYGSTSIALSFSPAKANTDTLIRLGISQLRIPGTDSISYTLAFTNDCGSTISRNIRSSVKDTILFSGEPTYTQNACKISTRINVSYGTNVSKVSPITTSYSFDNGATWSGSNTRILNPGQTYILAIANSCRDTTRKTITTPAYDFPATLSNSPSYSCPGKGGIYFRVGGTDASSVNMDSVTVLSQPGNSLPTKFRAVNVRNGLDTGKYVFFLKDTCGNTKLDSVVVDPLRLVIQLTDTGVGGLCNGFGARKLVLRTISNHNDFNASFVNTGTGAITRFRHNASSGVPVQYDLPAGNYLVKVWSRNNTNDSSCARTANFNGFTGSAVPAYSLSQSLFTSGCANSTATIVSRAIGGGGGNTYSLYLGGSQLVAPTPNNTFNGLMPGSISEVRGTDTCGNGTQFSTSFSNAPVPIYASQNTQPCNGDSITLSTTQYDNAVYSWTKNSQQVQQSGFNTYGYRAPAAPPYTIDTFRVSAAFGSCAVPAGAKVIVNPQNCGQPLPLLLQSLSGKFLSNGLAQISWKATTPEAFAAFSIQYSATGSDFRTVETLPATPSPDYSFTDNLKSDFTQYYRIKAHTLERTEVYSNVISLRKGRNTASENSFSLASNRVGNSLLVHFTAVNKSTATWQILNLSGQVVSAGTTALETANGQFSVAGLESLTSGLYLIRIESNGNVPFAGKFERL